MSTGAFAPAVEQLRGVSHRQVLRAVAIDPDAGPLALAIESAQLTWDETTAPRVVAQLEVAPTPEATLEQLAALDPRAGVRVTLEAGYVLAGGAEESHQIADLGLRRVTASRPANTVRLELASDEALTVDASPAVNAPVTAASTSAAIGALIRQTINPAPVIVSSVTGPAVTVDPVTDRWATIADLADRIGAKVYDDGTRRWRITAAPALGEPAVTLQGGPGGTLVETEDSADRSLWSNYVVHVYEWRDSAGVDKRVTATALIASGRYAVTGPAGKRITIDYRNVQSTQTDANAAARAVLARQLSRSTAQTVRAVAAWWLRPGDTARVVSLKGSEDRIVSRVSFSWPAAAMTVTTRMPDTVAGVEASPVTTTTPPSAPVEPDPTPPARQTYTSSWRASSFGTFRSDGTKRTDSGVSDRVAFGNSQTGRNGNQRAVVIFGAANSTGDETGKTITAALTGATVHRVRLRSYATHWYSYAGGTGRIGWFKGTAVPASSPAVSPYVTVKEWPRKSWRWAELSSAALHRALEAGTCRGVTYGPGATSSSLYYGNVSCAGSTLPELEITYSK